MRCRRTPLARVVGVTQTAPVLIIPGSPALVAELAPAHAASRRLATAAREASVASAARPVDVVCDLADDAYTSRTGSLAAWGAPQVTVSGGNYGGELVARYVLGSREYRPARAEIGALDPRALTVVVVDGPAGLTQRAPLALVEDAPATHEALEAFLATGKYPLGEVDEAALASAGVIRTRLWRELSLLNASRTRLIDADDSLGVGRYVAEWEVRV